MINYHCPICGEPTKKSIDALFALLWHFRPVTSPKVWWGFIFGTYKHFGLKAVITLISPLLNTVLHWKYRKARLSMKETQSL